MNQHIVVAVLIIGATGVIKSFTSGKPITPVIIGSYIFLLILSIMDMFGGAASQLGSALAMLAVVVVLLKEFPWSVIQGLVSQKAA